MTTSINDELPDKETKIEVWRRYTDFEVLDRNLEEVLIGVQKPELPDKYLNKPEERIPQF